MTSQLEIPNYELAAKSLHSTSHEVFDSLPGNICTETSSNTSFTENNVLRVKEIRCDRNNGKIRTTGIIISNKNQVQAGQVVPDSAIYDNVGGFTTAKIVTFDNTINNSALVVKSGGAYFGEALKVNGTVTASILNAGSGIFESPINFEGGYNANSFSVGVGVFSTMVNTPEIETTDALNIKRNAVVTATINNVSPSINLIKYLKAPHPRFCIVNYSTSAVTVGTSSTARRFAFNRSLVDASNNITLSTGTFTAPVSGIYRFFFIVQMSTASSTGECRVAFRKNDLALSPQSVQEFSTYNGRRSVHMEASFAVYANEFVNVIQTWTSSMQYDATIQGITCFGGHLISRL